MHARTVYLAAVTVVALSATVGCGDDDDAPTAEAYCAELETLDSGEGGGPTDAIFEKSPDPTLEDWADGLPAAIEQIRESRDDFAAIDPPEGMADERQAVLASLDDIADGFERSREAASAGDQQAFDAVEAEVQGELVPAMGAAMEAVIEACGGE